MADKANDTGDQSILSVRTVSADGKAPRRRMATPAAAWTAYNQVVKANRRRDARFGDIAGIFMGGPPTPPNTLERNGQADMPNINTKEFQAKVNTYTSTWTAMNAMGDGYMEVQAVHDDPMEAERRSKVLTEESNASVRLWDIDDPEDFESGSQYTMECAARDTQMGLFGIGIAFFRDPIDFRFRMIPTRRVLLPDGVRLPLDNCPAMYIQDTMSVTDLYGMIGKPGWNKAAILRNLYEHVQSKSQPAGQKWSYAEWVNQIRDNNTWHLSELLPVFLVHQFVMEFDQTITHSIFTELYGIGRGENDATDKGFEEGSEGFVFDRMKAAKRWKQIIVPFADNAGPECDWHGVKGFGDLIFEGCHLNNLMFNRAAIGGFMRNLLMFRGSGENDTQKLDQLTFTQFGMMAPGLEFEQIKFDADIEGALAVLGMGKQIISENTRIAPQNEKTTTREQPTATQVQADRADRAQLTTLQIAIYRAIGQDVLFGEMYRRMAQPASKYPESWGGGKVAKRFRDRCAKRGIPEADLLKVKLVRANRNVGSGDLALDIMKADQLISVATPGKGQLNARKEKVAALKGVEMVSAFIEEEQDPPGTPEAILSMENNLIQLGQVPIAIGAQDQQQHVVSHMQLLGQGVQAANMVMEQGIGPQNLEGAKKLSNMLVAGVEHVNQHVALMSELPRIGKQPAFYEEFVNAVAKQVHNVEQVARALSEDVASADQAQQPQVSPEAAKAQQQMQIDAAKAEQDMAIKDAAAKAKLGNQAVQTQAKTQMKLTDHATSVALQQQKDALALETEAAKKTLEINADAALKQQEIAAQAAKDEIAIDTAKKKAAATPKKPKAKK